MTDSTPNPQAPARAPARANRFETYLTWAEDGLFLRLKDTKRELRTIMINIGPPPAAPDQELTAPVAFASLADARQLSEISAYSHNQDVMFALGKALGIAKAGY